MEDYFRVRWTLAGKKKKFQDTICFLTSEVRVCSHVLDEDKHIPYTHRFRNRDGEQERSKLIEVGKQSHVHLHTERQCSDTHKPLIKDD